MNFTESLKNPGGCIKVDKEEAGTNASNKPYNRFQSIQDKKVTIQTLEITWRKVHGRIKKYHIIMVLSTTIKNIMENHGQNTFHRIHNNSRTNYKIFNTRSYEELLKSLILLKNILKVYNLTPGPQIYAMENKLLAG